MGFVDFFISFFKICCASPQEQQGQQQQHGYPDQHVGNQQTAYPPQGQTSWAAAASGGQQHQQQGYPLQQHQQGWQPPHQNGHAASSPIHLPSGGVVGPHAPASQHMNQDQVNATNEHYLELRNRARKEGDKAHQCFAASQTAYQAGDGAKAHELSQEGKACQRNQDQLDDEASAWIFNENNKQSPPGTIDLHGLYVKEAIERTESAITQCQSQGKEELRIIVGKGLHSQGGHAKIKPAVEDLMKKYNLSAYIDPENTGVLVIDLEGKQVGPRSRDIGGMIDSLRKKDEGCIIM
ncbi:hypothetical protein L204_103074 [Cryptococcus depauperatus]